MPLASRIVDLAAAIRDKFNLVTPRLLPAGGSTGQSLAKTSGADNAVGWVANDPKLVIVIDGGGVAITAGSKLLIPNLPAGTLLDWTLTSDATGSIVIDLKKATYSNFPTTTSITGSAKPTLSSARKGSSSTLTSWTTSISAGDVLEVVVDSASTVQLATLTLTLRRS